MREEKYSNGSPKERFSVIKTESGSFLKSGEFKAWFSNGQVATQGHYAKGKRTGRWEMWFENGQKQSDLNFKNDTLDGAFVSYHSNGMKEMQGGYNRGRQIGTWSGWSKTGKLIKKGNFDAQGQLHGLQENWGDNGNKTRAENYSNGQRDGWCKQWTSDGKLIMNAQFIQGSLTRLPANFITQKGSTIEFLSPTEYRARVLSNRDSYKAVWKEASGNYYFKVWDDFQNPRIHFGDEYLYELEIYMITNDTIKTDKGLWVRQNSNK